MKLRFMKGEGSRPDLHVLFQALQENKVLDAERDEKA